MQKQMEEPGWTDDAIISERVGCFHFYEKLKFEGNRIQMTCQIDVDSITIGCNDYYLDALLQFADSHQLQLNIVNNLLQQRRKQSTRFATSSNSQSKMVANRSLVTRMRV